MVTETTGRKPGPEGFTARSQAERRGRRPGAEAAFRASVEERLKSLEAQIEEVKSRLNGLLFFIAGTVIAQVLLRLVE